MELGSEARDNKQGKIVLMKLEKDCGVSVRMDNTPFSADILTSVSSLASDCSSKGKTSIKERNGNNRARHYCASHWQVHQQLLAEVHLSRSGTVLSVDVAFCL